MKQADKMRHLEIEERNGIVRFINECCVLDPASEVKTSKLYERYIQSCDHDLLVGKNKFIRLLREETTRPGHVISAIKTSAYRGWKGISLALAAPDINPSKDFVPKVDGLSAVKGFIENICLIGPNEYVKVSDLYGKYIDWVKKNHPDNLDLLFGVQTLASKTRSILTNRKVEFDYTTYKDKKWFRGIGIETI